VACKVRYLNSAGIMPREIRGIEALANAFPSEWLLYVSLNCFPRNQQSMEIDAVVVTDQCVLLLEIKDWHGKLTQRGDVWYVGKANRGRSAVIQVAEKARKLKTVLLGELRGALSVKLWVEGRVVLTGSSDKSHLPVNEAQFIWSLDEARSLGEPSRRKSLLPNGTLTFFKLYQLETEFDQVLGNSKLFQPLEADWGGYQVVERDIFMHPRGIWQDHRGARRDESRLKAMVRTWSFDKLPPGLNSLATRRTVAHRETRAFAYLQDMQSSLLLGQRVMREISSPHEEVLTQHFEVRHIEQGWTTLDRYLEKTRDDLTLPDRFTIASALLNLVSDLHSVSVTHRDLGPRALWLGSPSTLTLTGLMSCQLPDQETVADWLDDLRGYAPELPEDENPRRPSTGRQRDVYMLAHLIAMIVTGERPNGDMDAFLEKVPADIRHLISWFQKGLAPDPSNRFPDAMTMREAFSALIEPSRPVGFDQALLDRFETMDNPYVTWPVHQVLPSRPDCTVFKSATQSGNAIIIKVWNGLRRGTSVAIDMALYRLLDSVARLTATPITGLPSYVKGALSPVGPYIVYEHCSGQKLCDIESFSEEDGLEVARALITTITQLHGLECEHGDISPANAVFDQEHRSFRLLDAFDVTAVGQGAMRTPAFCPENWETWTQQSLDRYACLKTVEHVLQRSAGECVKKIIRLVANELCRPSLESLDPVAHAISTQLAQKSRSPSRISISTPANTYGFEGGDGFFLQSQTTGEGQERITLTNAGGQLVLEGDHDKVKRHYFQQPAFQGLAHESRTGRPIDISVAVTPGREEGVDELYRLLKAPITTTTADAPLGQETPRIDVEYLWRRLVELEENARTEVEITEAIGSRDGVSVFRYQNLSDDFDFDADATVEVYNSANKRIGEVDRSLSDFPSAIAIRADRRISVNERVRLVDRREQTSIDRRRRAIMRVLEGRSAISNLIEYFRTDCELEPSKYPLSISEDDLACYSLNYGQETAFRTLLECGPVGLLQGPPGTGKTRFIASFVHWLLTKGGAQRVLIASQYHEAVHNAIESLLNLYKNLGGRPNLLRIGSKGITSRIKPYHSAELRERYRVKFEAAAKFRFGQLASAKGIPKKFSSDLFDLDGELGVLARRCLALTRATDASERVTADERARRETQVRRAEAALSKAARAVFGQEVEVTDPENVLEQAISALVDKHPDVSPSDVEAARSLLELTQDWISALASPQRNFEEFLAKTRNVVAATCVGVGQTHIRIDSQVFDWVIVDEAARCTPGELAVPIQMARRVLMVGDHFQLRPMVNRDILDVLHEESMVDEPRGELEASDFERAFSSQYGLVTGCRFTEQYRMHSAICEMVSECFYEPHSVTLRTSLDRLGGLAVDPSAAPWLSTAMTWVDTSRHAKAHESRLVRSTTRFNDAEVETIIHLLEDIANERGLVEHLSKGEDETPIGVICMYAGQKARIEDAWSNHPWDAKFRRLVRIDTVDAYQGKENEIVIVSLVCNNAYGDIGHVRSPNRCNVAVSRARERLVIVGALEMFEKMPPQNPMTAVLNHMKRDRQNAQILSWSDLR